MPPKIKLPLGHVTPWTLGLVPIIAYAVHYQRNAPNAEEMEEILKKNYSANIQKSQDRRAQLERHFQSFQDNDEETNKKYSQMLYGGRGEMKRQHHVDEAILGTEEGAKRAAEELDKMHENKKKSKKKIKKDEKELENKKEEEIPNIRAVKTNEENKNTETTTLEEDVVLTKESQPVTVSRSQTQMASVLVVGVLATAAGFILGRSNSSSR